jgi:UDP-N-acetylmuramoylalanine--D-glutamate ligase
MMTERDIAVLELSSFQLMTMKKSPQIAVVTNLAPNHLDVHSSMEEYVDAKRNIYLHQCADDRLILNWDNDITREFRDSSKGKVEFFSRREQLGEGTSLADGVIYRNGEKVLAQEDILIPGVHNVENYMAAVAAVADLVPREVIIEFAKSFGGVEHRIELVRELNGVRYYNDSIASSPTRTIAGLRSFREKVILIAGGYDKNIPYDVLGPEIVKHVKLLVLTGATGSKIKAAVLQSAEYTEGMPEIIERDDFEAAILAARARAEEGDVVILSPASASFDHFKNFMERGQRFKEIVNALKEN